MFARNSKEMEKCKEIIERFSKWIYLDFGIDQYSVVHTKYGVILDLTCVTETNLVCVEDNCKYLGILECGMILPKEVKEAVRKEYLERL